MNDADLSAFIALIQGDAAPIEPARVVVTLLVAFVVSLGIAAVYRLAFRGALFSRSFGVALVGAAMVTALVIIPISSNITLSLGMVGALSIVRFRAAIKDPMDIVFMFWAIAAGLAAGAGFFGVSILGSAVVGVLLLLASALPISGRPAMLLVVRYAPGAEAEIQALLPPHRLRSRAQDGEAVEVVAEVRVATDGALLTRLLAVDGVRDAQLVSATTE